MRSNILIPNMVNNPDINAMAPVMEKLLIAVLVVKRPPRRREGQLVRIRGHTGAYSNPSIQHSATQANI